MRVKICGITNVADALMAAQASADYLGYILNYPASPRYVSSDQAKEIILTVRAHYPTVKHVGVFVDADLDNINTVTEQLLLDVVQLHGTESLEYIKNVEAPETWKTIELQTPSDLQHIKTYSASPVVSAIVLDSGKGSGNVIADDLLGLIDTGTKIVLAGGISSENVVTRIGLLQPDIIDVNSGVETQPGKKDAKKIQALFTAINSV